MNDIVKGGSHRTFIVILKYYRNKQFIMLRNQNKKD